MGKDQHWDIHNHIYGDKPYSNIPDMEAIRQSNNLYAYCMGNPIHYVDFMGKKAGDKFKSVKAAVIDFAEGINGVSIQENVKAFADLMQKWDREEAAASLGIHYLSSSVLNRTYEYHLALYGEEFYLDEKAVETGWRPELFFPLLEEDVEVTLKQLSGKFPRLYEHEKWVIRHHCARYYEAAVCRLCKDMLSEIMESEAFGHLKKTEDFFVFFGRYRGEGEVIAKAVCSRKPGRKS